MDIHQAHGNQSGFGKAGRRLPRHLRLAWPLLIAALLLACSSELRSGVLPSAGMRIGPVAPVHLLTLSGSSDDSAFAVGVLKGWTARGDRPQFEAVTGIDAGALLAPFVFLGSDHDDVLGDAVPSIGQEGPFGSDELFAPPAGESTDKALAIGFVDQYITADVLQAIAAEHGKGRTLRVGRTEHDSSRTVTWNLGAVAASGAPGALERFRTIVLASAGVPGMEPSVIGSVHADARRDRGRRVGSGVGALDPACPSVAVATEASCRGDIQVYVIRNGRRMPRGGPAMPDHAADAGDGPLAGRFPHQGGDAPGRIERMGGPDGPRYHIAYIGSDFQHPAHGRFDAAYVRELCDYGYRLGIAGDAWRKGAP